MCAHLPVKDNTPDETQGQLVVSIHNICASYVYQINLKDVTDKDTWKKNIRNITNNGTKLCLNVEIMIPVFSRFIRKPLRNPLSENLFCWCTNSPGVMTMITKQVSLWSGVNNIASKLNEVPHCNSRILLSYPLSPHSGLYRPHYSLPMLPTKCVRSLVRHFSHEVRPTANWLHINILEGIKAQTGTCGQVSGQTKKWPLTHQESQLAPSCTTTPSLSVSISFYHAVSPKHGSSHMQYIILLNLCEAPWIPRLGVFRYPGLNEDK